MIHKRLRGSCIVLLIVVLGDWREDSARAFLELQRSKIRQRSPVIPNAMELYKVRARPARDGQTAHNHHVLTGQHQVIFQ